MLRGLELVCKHPRAYQAALFQVVGGDMILFHGSGISGQFDVKVSLKVEGKLLTKTFRNLSKEKWLDFKILEGKHPQNPLDFSSFFCGFLESQYRLLMRQLPSQSE